MERAAERMDAKGIEEVDRNQAGGNISMESYLSEDEKSRKQGQAEAGEDYESESDDEVRVLVTCFYCMIVPIVMF